jgi:hypothetical protein
MTTSYINYEPLYNNGYGEHREVVSDTLQYWIKSKDITPGGFAFGIGAFAGFNILLQKKISFGAEVSSSALYYKLGGITISESTAQVIPNMAYSEYDTFTNSYKGFKISKIISSFNITFWL